MVDYTTHIVSFFLFIPIQNDCTKNTEHVDLENLIRNFF